MGIKHQPDRAVVTIQKTSKPLKFRLVLFNVLSLIGIWAFFFVPAHQLGAEMFFSGTIGVIITKIMIWWNHA